MFAFFNNFDGDAETKNELSGLQAPFIILGSDEQKTKFAELEKAYVKARPKIEKLAKKVRQEKDKAKKKKGRKASKKKKSMGKN